MTNRLRVATWNLDRPGFRKKNRLEPQLEVLASINADILILTETHESARPSGYEHHLASEPDPRYHKSGESCASIWSRYPLTAIPTAADNRYFTVCAEIQGPTGIGPMIVYGTIITYHGDGVYEGVPAWSRHRTAVTTQVAEWYALSQRYPDHMRIIAGDFNENLDGKRWYGVKDAKAAITTGLTEASMTCPTAATDLSLINGPGRLSRSTVNHICVSEFNATVVGVRAWEGTQSDTVLSDHNGILVDIDVKPIEPTRTR